MTELDWPPVPVDDMALERTPRKCRRHEWGIWPNGRAHDPMPEDLYPEVVPWCRRCGRLRDVVASRRGKSARRLGHDGERRSERRYGWRKVGEYGGITDLEGTLAIVQQKTSRRAPPAAWMSIFRALEGRAGGRVPLVLLSFVRAGVDTEDFIVIRGRDWIQMHGKDEPNG